MFQPCNVREPCRLRFVSVAITWSSKVPSHSRFFGQRGMPMRNMTLPTLRIIRFWGSNIRRTDHSLYCGCWNRMRHELLGDNRRPSVNASTPILDKDARTSTCQLPESRAESQGQTRICWPRFSVTCRVRHSQPQGMFQPREHHRWHQDRAFG